MVTVLHIITGLGSGGAERNLTRIASHNFGPKGPRQVVVSLMDEGMHGATLRAAGVRVHTLGMRRGRLSFGPLLQLRRILREESPDVVMTWLYHADLLGALLAPSVPGAKLIWNVRCADMDMSRYALTSRVTRSALALLSGRPWAVATNSKRGRSAHEELGYRPRRWYLLPNGFDLRAYMPDVRDRAAVRREFNVRDDELLVGLVARVDPMKDHDTFLAAAERIAAARSDVVFLLVGAGTQTLQVPAALAARVRGIGERVDIPRLLRALDVNVLSSISEGFPNVVGEAMATAVPCVVTNVGDAAELVGDTGRVVPPRDPERLAAALLGILNSSAETRRQLGIAARARIVEHWSLEAAATRYERVWVDATTPTPSPYALEYQC